MRYLVWCEELMGREDGQAIDSFQPDWAAQDFCEQRYPKDDYPTRYDGVVVEDPAGKRFRFSVAVDFKPIFVASPEQPVIKRVRGGS